LACIQVTTTLGTREAADGLGAALVAERLAACAQVVGPVSSTYRWAGRVEQAEEWYCHLKTTRARLPEITAAIRARHSYELPEIVALPLDGSEEYLRWIAESVG
jgi:periplasmic divalent cation tolerance protein